MKELYDTSKIKRKKKAFPIHLVIGASYYAENRRQCGFFLVAFNTLNSMTGTTYKRMQGIMVHVVLTSREVHLKNHHIHDFPAYSKLSQKLT